MGEQSAPACSFQFFKNVYGKHRLAGQKIEFALKEPFLLIKKLIRTCSSKHFFELNISGGGEMGNEKASCALGILKQMVLMDYLDVLADRYVLYNSLIRSGMLSAWHIVQ